MPPIDSQPRAVIGRFTVSQMRDLLAALIGVEASSKIPTKTQADLQSHLETFPDQKKLMLLAHRAEALAPYKHCIPVELSASNAEGLTSSSIASEIKRKLPQIVSGYDPLSSDELGLHPQVCVVDSNQDRVFLKLAHQVEVWETQVISTREKRRHLVKRRHVVVLTFRPLFRLLTVSFPGFSQGQIGEERKSYLDIALDALKLAREILPIKTDHLNLKPGIDYLLEDPTKGVIDLHRSALPAGGGKLTLDSQHSNVDSATILAESLRAEGGAQIDVGQVRKALRAMAAGDVALLWQKAGIATRISLQGPEPEVLFVWSDADPSLDAAERLLLQLIAASREAPSPTFRDFEKYLATTAGGDILRPVALAQTFSMSPDRVLALLFEEASLGKLAIRFRLRSERLLRGYSNSWKASIADLPSQVRDEDDLEISGRDPKSIEVAFEKVGQ